MNASASPTAGYVSSGSWMCIQFVQPVGMVKSHSRHEETVVKILFRCSKPLSSSGIPWLILLDLGRSLQRCVLTSKIGNHESLRIGHIPTAVIGTSIGDQRHLATLLFLGPVYQFSEESFSRASHTECGETLRLLTRHIDDSRNPPGEAPASGTLAICTAMRAFCMVGPRSDAIGCSLRPERLHLSRG
jgi:hypothetical protein